MLKLVIPDDEAKLATVLKLLQTMMEPDPEQRATPIDILNNVCKPHRRACAHDPNRKSGSQGVPGHVS